ncbi:MAG: hypothetical protein ACPGGK_00410 [Pikeienuella sp.]
MPVSSSWFSQTIYKLLTRFWVNRYNTQPLEGGPRDSRQPTDNVMRTMNLIMPLKNKTAVGRAEAVMAIGACLDEIYTGLDNVGTVHMARFSIVDNTLLMFSYYDGDFHTYIRDFIMTLGNAFDGVVELVEDTPPLPCWQNVDAFISWVHERDAFQVPEDLGVLCELVSPDMHDLHDLPRYLAVQMEKNPNIQIGSYRSYPGFSVAQIRQKMGVGW